MAAVEAQNNKVESKYVYEWDIRNFNCNGVNNLLPSAKFQFNLSTGNISFIGSLSILGPSCGKRKLLLSLTSINYSSWDVQCKISHSKTPSNAANLSAKNPNLEVLLQYYDRNRHLCSLHTDSNIITCEIHHVKYISTKGPTLVSVKKTEHSEDIAKLFEAKLFWDITLEAAGQEFHAHKGILACRSPVFSAMFEHRMMEATSNKVLIEDIEPKVLQELLRFIYTDNVSNLETVAAKLLAAGAKYDLPRLKSMCENELAGKLSIENAAEILIVADLYKADALKDIAKNFIECNKQAVGATQGWQEILKNHSHRLIPIFFENIKSL